MLVVGATAAPPPPEYISSAGSVGACEQKKRNNWELVRFSRPSQVPVASKVLFLLLCVSTATEVAQNLRPGQGLVETSHRDQPLAAWAMIKEQFTAFCLSLLPWLGPLVYRDGVTPP